MIMLIIRNINIVRMDWLIKTRNKPRYEGSYNFYLSLNNDSIDSSSSISITAFTDSKQRAVVPCTYTWFLIKNGITQQVSQFKGSSFLCDTSHIGQQIQVHIISNDMQYPGKAIVTLGPVELDVSLKSDILNALGQGYGSSAVYLLGPEQQQRQCILKVSESQIKIMHSFSDLHYYFDYSINEPTFIPHPKEVTRLTIHFGEKYESQVRKFQKKIFTKDEFSSPSNRTLKKSNNSGSQSSTKFEIRFLSRALRDVFLFIIKAFIVKRQLKNSVVVRKIQNINFGRQEQFNAIIQIDSLKRDLMRFDRNYKQMAIDRKRLIDDKSRLEMDLQTLSHHLKDREKSMMTSSVSTRRDFPMSKNNQQPPFQYQKLQRQNEALNNRIRALAEQVDRLKTSKVSTVVWNPPPTQFNSPTGFKKKQYDNESLVNVLEDLNKNQTITHFDYEKNMIIQKLQGENISLIHKVQMLQNKLQRSQSKGALPGINFTYKPNLEANNMIESLKRQKQELRIINIKLTSNLTQMRSELETMKTKTLQGRNQPMKIQNQLNKIRHQNRASENLIQSRIDSEKLTRLEKEINVLKDQLSQAYAQNEDLKKKIVFLTQQSNNFRQDSSGLSQKCMNLQKRYKELEQQVEMYRRNQETLNRTQNLSMQMDQYNEQQIQILKQHNSFLVTQNEKLVKACEKYMSEAKQSNKLRQQILQLKQKLNTALTNPEANPFAQ